MNQNAMAKERIMDITVNPAWLLIGAIPLRFSVGLSDHILRINVTVYFLAFMDIKNTRVSGGLDAKFYLTNHVYNDSWYIKPKFTPATLR